VIVLDVNKYRIGGKQYSLDASLKLKMDNKLYKIERMEYDATRVATVLRVTETNEGYLANQPLTYNFYRNNQLLASDAVERVSIKPASWVPFRQILISDPSHYVYGNTTYSLINAIVRLDGTEYQIVDTAWRGKNQVLDIYLQ